MIAFASSTASALIAAPDGSKFGSIIVAGVSGTAAVVKNLRVSAVLNTVSVQMNPAARYEGPPFSLQLQLPNAPTVDGVQPHSWVYAFDVSSIDGTYIFSIRQNSIAFRSANYKVPMPAIASTEELVMVAPRNPVLLRTSAESPTASADVKAMFLLRDLPAPISSITRQPARRSVTKVGRNDPCPCGSGKKHKKCCGQRT